MIVALEVKICGINSRAALDQAAKGGARYVGFVFYARSPRHVTPAQAGAFARATPKGIVRVGLMVDADDEFIASALAEAPLEMLQLHGAETPARAAAIKARFGVSVMKAIKLAEHGDLEHARAYFGHVDRLLFDAKAPATMAGALPGGNALAFDWTILRHARVLAEPGAPAWMLSGGLTPENLAEAARVTGACAVDVSSGVEDAPGHKSPARIAAFLAAAAAL